ncbi:MAG: type I pantothenate kinase [Actinomycetota bacterium]|nr:type I pantothenate kinase [Actinomycetota bacterium]
MVKKPSELRLIDRGSWSELIRRNESYRQNRQSPFGVPPIELDEIYFPICERIWSLWSRKTTERLKTPLIIGITGSVAVGKTTVAEAMKDLLESKPFNLDTELVSTDNFLYPNEVLTNNRIFDRKGFPESFDYPAILEFLKGLTIEGEPMEIPTYSHEIYDIIDRTMVVKPSDVLIIEGVNILQTPKVHTNRSETQAIRDYVDFSIYIDAEEAHIKDWYTKRFLNYCEAARSGTNSFFSQFKDLSFDQTNDLALSIWTAINSTNLLENISPSMEFADLVLRKGEDHSISQLTVPRDWLSNWI